MERSKNVKLDRRIKTWLSESILTTFIPIFAIIVVGWISSTLSFSILINQGDLLLLTYSLVSTQQTGVKVKSPADAELEFKCKICSTWLTIMIIVQSILFASIKMKYGMNTEICFWPIAITIVATICSVLCCIWALRIQNMVEEAMQCKL